MHTFKRSNLPDQFLHLEVKYIYFLAIIWMHCSHLVAITLTEKNKHNAIFIDHFNHYITHCVDTSWDCSASFVTFPVIKHSVLSLNHLKCILLCGNKTNMIQ